MWIRNQNLSRRMKKCRCRYLADEPGFGLIDTRYHWKPGSMTQQLDYRWSKMANCGLWSWYLRFAKLSAEVNAWCLFNIGFSVSADRNSWYFVDSRVFERSWLHARNTASLCWYETNCVHMAFCRYITGIQSVYKRCHILAYKKYSAFDVQHTFLNLPFSWRHSTLFILDTQTYSIIINI